MSEKDRKDRYEALADWAEHDMTIATDDPPILRGQAAAEFGRTMLERAGAGRPRLDPTEAVTGRSLVGRCACPKRSATAWTS
ncbi:MAG: hypothetical protein ACRC35_03140 [Angustibacter sp.]